ncbi:MULTISPECIES: MarR family winged helix-turn-helix transcriptional regulator [Amycolatopsis]|uniref:MarR family winged helix-turn-helix transcriptional regulator n=1 Tax=Amycolatopsis sp. CB00013 TaxID=1703945 RepID=UPI00093D0890|nr:helix-turn-helix domain-containing protein [Amycolatopsis sp. CB00013]OKJ91271.1 MarR family transcriptional regulator [Amycolatopsis sp. CB00013]
MADDVAARSASLLDGLRSFGANYTEFTRRFADWLGLHATDAAALVEILYAEDTGSPLSPARLGERIALTSGATTNLLNRLENLGYVVRTRENTDRRVVTLRSGTDIQAPAREFFGPFSAGLAALVAEYPPEEIERFEGFLRQLKSTMDDVLEEQA